jgi:hypothetical protein
MFQEESQSVFAKGLKQRLLTRTRARSVWGGREDELRSSSGIRDGGIARVGSGTLHCPMQAGRITLRPKVSLRAWV